MLATMLSWTWRRTTVRDKKLMNATMMMRERKVAKAAPNFVVTLRLRHFRRGEIPRLSHGPSWDAIRLGLASRCANPSPPGRQAAGTGPAAGRRIKDR